MKLKNTSIANLIANAEKISLEASTKDYKPSKLFIYTYYAEKHSMLECAILADIGYWFATKGSVWRKYSDWVEWLGVSESTIKRTVNRLYESGYFERQRTRFTKRRGLGSYEFFPTVTKVSKELVSEYTQFIQGKYKSNDLIKGEIVDNESNEFARVNVNGRPKFQPLFLSMVDEIGSLKLAYLLSRLCWLWVKDGEQTISFESASTLADYSGLNYHKVRDQLQYLEQRGHILIIKDHGQLFITVTQRGYDACDDLLEWLFELQDKRNFVIEEKIDYQW